MWMMVAIPEIFVDLCNSLVALMNAINIHEMNNRLLVYNHHDSVVCSQQGSQV
jgi:hypothetical protein